MKFIKIATLFLLIFIVSCSKSSTEEDDEKNENNSIVGVWELQTIVPIENGSEEDLEESQAFKEGLEALNCSYLSIEFRVDDTFVATYFEFVDQSNGADPDNLNNYTCEFGEQFSGTWSLNTNVLVLRNSGDILELPVRFEGSSTLYVIGGHLLGDEEDLAKEQVFVKLLEA